jgi:hypothetical protein
VALPDSPGQASGQAGGEAESEVRALGARSDFKGAVVGDGDALGDGQAEAGATGSPRAGVVEAGETFEDPLVVFRRDAGSVVLDVENGFAVFRVVG